MEAKEGVRIERENQTLATITFQNYFRMYDTLAGMTGTAETEATEFGEIYELDVEVMPTNDPMVRDDREDVIYRTAEEKWEAVVEEIRECERARSAGSCRHHLDRELGDALQAVARQGLCRMSCSTPSSTSAKPRSSPRPAARDR